MTTTSNYQVYHARIAARLRSIAAGATTMAVKARLLSEAEERERIAQGHEEPIFMGRRHDPVEIKAYIEFWIYIRDPGRNRGG